MQKQTFWNKFYKIFHFSLQNWEISFNYKGDIVTYIYPWNRKWGGKYYSLFWNGREFKSLKDLDKFNNDCDKFFSK